MLEATCKTVAACYMALVSHNTVLNKQKTCCPSMLLTYGYDNMPHCISLASACILLELTISSEAHLQQNGGLLLASALAQGACSVNAPAAGDLFLCR